MGEKINLVCEQCQASFNIPEKKLPFGKTLVLTCPKCSNKISFIRNEEGEKESRDELPDLREEGEVEPYLGGSKSGLALVCVEDEDLSLDIVKATESLGYKVFVVREAHEALKHLRMNSFGLVLVHESFGGVSAERNSVLLYLERLPMLQRRDIYVIMLSQRHSTLDSLIAFLRSVNLVVNVRHANDLVRIISQGLEDYRDFYEVFMEVMKESRKV